MKKFVSALGSLMVLGGMILLAYVAFAFVHRQPVAAPKRWTAAQQLTAHKLARELAVHQQLRVHQKKAVVAAPNSSYAFMPGSEPALRIIIPKIHVDAPVVQTAPIQGVWEVADWAVGHLTTTPDPGAAGNGAYSAHDDIKGELFKRIGELVPGDSIQLRTRHALYTYAVVNQQIVDPTNIHPLDPTSNATVTLISCYPYWVDTQRTIIQGVLKSTTRG